MSRSEEQQDDTNLLLLFILLTITGTDGPFIILWMLFHPIRTLKIAAGLTALAAMLAGIVAVFVFTGWWGIPLLGSLIGGLTALNRATAPKVGRAP